MLMRQAVILFVGRTGDVRFNPESGHWRRYGLPPTLVLQPFHQQPHVSPIRAPQHIEGVADQWHRAQYTIERYVAEHARDDVAWRAELVGLAHDEQRQRRSDGVADDGNEPDQRIEAEAHTGAGDDQRGVEQGGKRVDPRDAGATKARTR